MKDFLDENGEIRLLARLEPSTEALDERKLCKALPVPVLPRSQWRVLDSRKLFNMDFILNQGQYGACVGYSAATATMRQRAYRGLEYARLSGAYIYDQINGGRDNGACITDSKTVLEKTGTCLESEYQHPVMNRRTQPASLGRFKLSEAYTISTFDEMGTVITLGGQVQLPIRVGQNFQQYSSDGVAGFTPGPGNHSVCGDGLLNINGTWFILVPNTWGAWGPWKTGYVLISERHVESAGADEDAYAHLAEAQDSQDTNNPVMA